MQQEGPVIKGETPGGKVWSLTDDFHMGEVQKGGSLVHVEGREARESMRGVFQNPSGAAWVNRSFFIGAEIKAHWVASEINAYLWSHHGR